MWNAPVTELRRRPQSSQRYRQASTHAARWHKSAFGAILSTEIETDPASPEEAHIEDLAWALT
jgi:hypothetical protein